MACWQQVTLAVLILAGGQLVALGLFAVYRALREVSRW